jgi:ApbE superfamily uncharacterized protein (UPF0280 family)
MHTSAQISPPEPYNQRFYRSWVREDLERFQVTLGQSDLLILCDRQLKGTARGALRRVRRRIERQIEQDPRFASALEPYPVDAGAPAVVRGMARAAARWQVGPMAAVAGAVAGAVGRHLLRHARTVIVENGGDIFARAPRRLVFRLYAGADSPFSDRLGFEVDARQGIGVCTSSGVVGPSLSFGRADAVVAIADDPAEADAAATALANRIRAPEDVGRVVARERRHGVLKGLVACAGDRIGCFGELELRRVR